MWSHRCGTALLRGRRMAVGAVAPVATIPVSRHRLTEFHLTRQVPPVRIFECLLSPASTVFPLEIEARRE